MNKIKNRVLEIRKTLGLSQEAFGKSIGMTRSAISKIEKGENNLTDKNIKIICKQFGISKEWFLTGEGEMRKQESDFIQSIIGGLGDIDPRDMEIIKSYLNLDDKYREAFRTFLNGFLKR